MSNVTGVISKNIKRFRKLKKFSQKEVSAKSNVPQGQYSRIENGKVEPSVSTLEKLANVFEISIAAFFKTDDTEENVNLPLLEKVKLIDQLDKEEKNALLKMIDITISKKRMKDNLSNMLES